MFKGPLEESAYCERHDYEYVTSLGLGCPLCRYDDVLKKHTAYCKKHDRKYDNSLGCPLCKFNQDPIEPYEKEKE